MSGADVDRRGDAAEELLANAVRQLEGLDPRGAGQRIVFPNGRQQNDDTKVDSPGVPA